MPVPSTTPSTELRVIASAGSWIEGEAMRQLQLTAQLPGMVLAVGLPDLHPGRGTPVGAVFATQGVLYPYLVGNDVGCGMGLWQTGLLRRKIKRDRWVDKLHGLEAPWSGDTAPLLEEAKLAATGFDEALGTIGGGNHFAELQQVEEVLDPAAFSLLGLDEDLLALLIHSGSRGLGEAVLRRHTDQRGAEGLQAGSAEATAYLGQHDHAVGWAKINRALIQRRFLECLGTEGSRVLDVCHNSVSPVEVRGVASYLHRKGAAPSDLGPVVIPGSRGALSYLVLPCGDGEKNGWSLAHGAGRKYSRHDARGRIRDRFRHDELIQTELGSAVICENRDLLYEEAPEAYKKIDAVVGDLVEAGVARVIATFRPVITYKVRDESR
jgi:release factor H-coupled RctB family protein